jgi:hypothetical protein
MPIGIRLCGKANRAFLPRSRCSRSAQPCPRHREPLQGAIALRSTLYSALTKANQTHYELH